MAIELLSLDLGQAGGAELAHGLQQPVRRSLPQGVAITMDLPTKLASPSKVANSSSPPQTEWAASESKWPLKTDSRQKSC